MYREYMLYLTSGWRSTRGRKAKFESSCAGRLYAAKLEDSSGNCGDPAFTETGTSSYLRHW